MKKGMTFYFIEFLTIKKISGKNTFEIKNNPLVNSNKPMYIAKIKQRDYKKKFSRKELKTKKGIKVDYPYID